MDAKLNVVKDNDLRRAELDRSEELLAELKRVKRDSAVNDWLTAIVVIGGFVLPLAIVLWRWALS